MRVAQFFKAAFFILLAVPFGVYAQQDLAQGVKQNLTQDSTQNIKQGLLDIWHVALANDPAYAAAQAQLEATRERVPQSRASAWLPNLTGSAGVSENDNSSRTNSITVDSNRTTKTYSLALTQPLWRPQAIEALEQSKLAVLAVQAQFENARQDLALRVAQAYFDVLAAQDVLEALQAQKKAVVEQLASAKRNFEVGAATITDTNEAQAQFDLISAQEFAAQNDIEVKRSALQQIIGQPLAPLLPLSSTVALPAPQPNQIQDWITRAETGNLNVQAAQTNLLIAEREIDKARAGHLPTIDAVGSYNNSREPSIGVEKSVTNSVGLQLNLPIFAGFSVQARVRETLALRQQANQNLEAAKRAAGQTARQSFLGVNNGLSQVRALEAAEVSSQTSVDSTLLGYRVGVRVNLDVLNAQQQLFKTRRDLAKARYDSVLAGLRLKAAAATLQDDDVAAVDALLVR